MSNAIIVHEIYKKFGKPAEDSFWNQLFKKKNQNGKAQSNHKAKGKKRLVVAVDYVSFKVKEGEIFGVLGPNGSGKSTLIRLLATLLLPDSGDIKIFGYDPVLEPLKVQKLINRVSVEASFFKKLSPMENLIYGARL